MDNYNGPTSSTASLLPKGEDEEDNSDDNKRKISTAVQTDELRQEELQLQQKTSYQGNSHEKRAYVQLWITINVLLCVAVVSRQLCEKNKLYIGEWAEVTIMMCYYLPSFLICFVLPICFWEGNYEPLGSFALRLIHTIISILFIANEVGEIVGCLDGAYQCCWGGIQHLLEIMFFIGLAVYVQFNQYFPRSNIFHLFCYLHLCSAAIYTYIVRLMLEEKHIYSEIFNHTRSYSEIDYRIRGRVYWLSEEDQVNCSLTRNFVKCIFLEYREMIAAVALESLVVGISLIIAIISVVGESEEHTDTAPTRIEIPLLDRIKDLIQRLRSLNSEKLGWVVTIFFALIAEIVIVKSNYWKAEPNNFTNKLIYTFLHILFLIFGIVACIYFICKGHRRDTENTPLEALDQKLLRFGTFGILAYIWFALIHSLTLFDSLVFNAVTCLFVNLFSFAEVLIQTIIIQHYNLAHRSHSRIPAYVLWIVNYAMFSLDLFDAATFGFYAAPVPKGSNMVWGFIVRGLGPLNVFYRFHSLAIIAESIET